MLIDCVCYQYGQQEAISSSILRESKVVGGFFDSVKGWCPKPCIVKGSIVPVFYSGGDPGRGIETGKYYPSPINQWLKAAG